MPLAGMSGAVVFSTWEQGQREWGFPAGRQRSGTWWEGPGRGMLDGLRPAPMSTTARRPTVPFKVHEFMQRAPSIRIKLLNRFEWSFQEKFHFFFNILYSF